MHNDEARKAILARRARFVAAAMVSIAASGCDKKESGATVTAVPNEVKPRPAGTLEAGVAEPEPQAPGDPLPDSGGPAPMPCLKIARPPSPCLSIATVPTPSDAGAFPHPCLSKMRHDDDP